MMYLFKLLVLLFIGISTGQSLACMCMNDFKAINDQAQLKSYDFVALVKIKDDQDIKKPSGIGTVGLLTIEIIEPFKGEKVRQIAEYDKASSCDIGIEKGAEWLLFGRIRDGRISVGACDRNVKYRDTSGLRDWRANAYTQLYQLRKLSALPAKIFKTGIRKEYYPNKQIEIEEGYVHGKLDGPRRIWYPDGVLLCRQNYRGNSLHGKSEWFYPSSQIQNEDYFANGKPCNISRYYYDLTVSQSLKRTMVPYLYKTEEILSYEYRSVQPWFETVYDSKGTPIVQKEFTKVGKLRREVFLDPKSHVRTIIYYRENGLVDEISYQLNFNDHGHYQRYQENGLPGLGRDYDEKGREVIK